MGAWGGLLTEICFSQKMFLGPIGGGGGGGGFQKYSWGSETHGGILGRTTPPSGGRAGSGNDTLLPRSMTRTRDQAKILERFGLAVKSYHPETLAAEE